MDDSVVIFNELSIVGWREENFDCAGDFVEAIAVFADAMSKVPVLLNADSLFSNSRTVASVSDRIMMLDKDRRMLFLQSASKASSPPVASADSSEDLLMDSDIVVAGEVSVGAKIANERNALLVSVGTSAAWRCVKLEAMKLVLQPNESGGDAGLEDLVIQSSTVEVCHFYDEESSLYWSSIIKSEFASVDSRDEFWGKRELRFANIRFLASVERDIGKLEMTEYLSAVACLDKLQASVETWDPVNEFAPAWRTYVTPESETRRRLCWFTDEDGALHEFSLHARYTPTAGRIHLRLDRVNSIVVVAYVGIKL